MAPSEQIHASWQSKCKDVVQYTLLAVLCCNHAVVSITFTSTNTTLSKVHTFDLEHFLPFGAAIFGFNFNGPLNQTTTFLFTLFPTYSIHYIYLTSKLNVTSSYKRLIFTTNSNMSIKIETTWFVALDIINHNIKSTNMKHKNASIVFIAITITSLTSSTQCTT